MIDISTAGAEIHVKFNDMNGARIITTFSDEGTPFECPDVDVSTNAKNLNGMMISSRTPSVYPVSMTLIPGTTDDIFLNRRLAEAAIQHNSVTAISKLAVSSLTVCIPKIDAPGRKNFIKYTFKNGRLKNGPMGPSSSAEGRMSARTYTFEFEKYEPPTYKGDGGTTYN